MPKTKKQTCASVSLIPRGIEVLSKKAAVDASFREVLLRQRALAASGIRLTLNSTEAAMLNSIPTSQLRAVISNTKVSSRLKKVFMGYAVVVMLAALSVQAYPLDLEEVQTDKNISGETGVLGTETATKGTLTGRIHDLQGNGIPMTEVVIDGTRLGALTDHYGNYSISNIPEGEYTVVISRSGYKTKKIKHIQINADATTELSVSLIVAASSHYQIGGIRP